MAKQNKNQSGRLRIVAGIWGSRRLEIADVPGLRPTSERIRETLFNWLAPTLGGARCLDLCAGTGALGVEALSRGAAHVVFVEKSARATATLRANIAALGATGAEVQHADARHYLRAFAGQPFDVVFLDPSFAEDMLGELCRLLVERKALTKNARIYLELDKQQQQPDLPPDWEVLKNKLAGNVRYMLATPTL